MASNVRKLPVFSLQYFEYEQKIELPVEFCKSPFKIDGLFCPLSSNRFCLGCLENLNRKPDAFKCLINAGKN